MNWRITNDGDLEVETAEREDAEPDKQLVSYARTAAKTLREKLGDEGDEYNVEIFGHESTKGRGFKPAHVTISVSRLDPKR